MIIPIVQIAMKIPSSLGFTALRSIIIDGRESVVTAIIKDNTTPSSAPFQSLSAAIRIVPNKSAYIGTPAIVAKTTPKGLLSPRTFTINFSGIQL